MSDSQATAASDARGKGAVGRLLAFAGSRKALTYLGCALSAVSMLVSFGPYVCIWLVARDLIAVAPDWGAATGIAAYGWWAFGLAAASILIYFAGLMCTHLAAFRCASNMRKRTTDHLMHASLGYFDTHASGALRRVVDGCAAETEGLLAHKLPDTAGSIAMIVGMLVLFFVFDWRLGLACLVAVIISLGCMFYMMGGRGMDFMTRYMESLVKMNKTGTEYVRGIPVVKVFQQTVYSFRAFHDAIEEFTRLAQDYAVKWCQMPQSLSLTIINGVAIFLVPAAILVAPGEGDFARFLANFAFYAIFSAVIPTAMTRVMFMSEAFQSAADAVTRVEEVLAAPVISAPAAPRTPAGNAIRFEDVSFEYPDDHNQVLHHVRLDIKAGERLALVGPSGGGKTTLCNLIPRFYEVTGGRILIDGQDIQHVTLKSLREDIGIVQQDVYLFSGSVADNIAYGKPGATREEIIEAARLAGAERFISALKDGFDTYVGERGVKLSGGQKQRIAIARVFLKNPPILILDEATSALDNESEILVGQSLEKLAHGRTTLTIAHRLTTIKDYDRILVLGAEGIEESGTHDELLAKKGVYYRLWTQLPGEDTL